jgi:hypothetical protein
MQIHELEEIWNGRFLVNGEFEQIARKCLNWSEFIYKMRIELANDD